MKKIKDSFSNQVFTVERIEDGNFQSVFPERLAHESALHTSIKDAWAHIEEVRAEDDEFGDDHPARMSAAVRSAL